MSAQQTDPLLAAVEALTKPRTTWVMQANEAGVHCKSPVHHDPLLQQLREAVVGGIGSHSGSAAGSERLPFDVGAMKLYDEIETAITEWFVYEANQPVYLELERTLRQWFIAFDRRRRSGHVADDDQNEVIRRLERWAHQIEGKFDPPKKLELTVALKRPVMKVKTRRRIDKDSGVPYTEPVLDDAGEPVLVAKKDRKTKQPVVRVLKRQPATCPNCQAQFAYDPATGDKMLALVIEYRDEGTDTIDNGAGFCRACDTVWKAGSGMRELAYRIEQEEDKLNAS